jgi:gentisate 1,2-dioxygenase
VVHVIEGQGESRIGDQVLDWQAGDVFVVPPWQATTHRNRSGQVPACLFHLNDEPALRALGLWHEEADA